MTLLQYIPAESNLRVLLQNEAYMQMLLSCMENRANADTITDFCDGNLFQRKFSGCSKLTILLYVFYDVMGVANPLRGQSSLCNMGVFYYVIMNVDNRFNSCHANVHLLGLCYSHDFKVYGFDAFLHKFVTETNRLATDGFEQEFPIIGRKRVYVCLCQCVCDNLALNGLFGFVECFTWDHFCTMCLAKQEGIQE
jgi:hypothetical protein